jgi:hypothetical protein
LYNRCALFGDTKRVAGKIFILYFFQAM